MRKPSFPASRMSAGKGKAPLRMRWAGRGGIASGKRGRHGAAGPYLASEKPNFFRMAWPSGPVMKSTNFCPSTWFLPVRATATG